jgi:dTDP-4-amino-4,6-dideoxygalactose transaminase
MSVMVPFTDLGAMTQEVRPAIDRGWARLLEQSAFIGGEVVEEFEHAWAEYCGVAHAVGVANGTDALQLTLKALGIGAGDEVIVPSNTFVASAEAVVLCGATPRFADVSPQTMLLTSADLEAVITSRTRAVIVVHLYGQMPDMDSLCRTADRTGILLIEDAAQAHGATWRGRRAGSIGRAGCFSFYPGKNLGAFGDAGAVVTSDSDLAKQITSLRDHGRVAGSHYSHDLIGTNSRLDALQAIVLTAKLARLDAWNEARRSIVARYRAAFASAPVHMVEDTPGGQGVYHLAVARVPDRARIQQHLTTMGIQSSIHYPIPCHQQAPYVRFAAGPLPVTEAAATEIVSLPIFPHMRDDQLDRVCGAVLEALSTAEVHGA